MRSGDYGPHRRRAGGARLAAGDGRAAVGPLYERLPHGPHQLDRKEVTRNQRARIHGGMIEAVSRHGYEHASVKRVITLAGVSRRSFYEQFPNKRDCFLATFDLLAARELRRARSAYVHSSGGVDARLHAIVSAYVEGAREEPKGTHLLLLDALAVGEAGLTRVCRTAAAHEQLLGECFQRGARGAAPSAPLLRALLGGLQGVVGARLAAGAPARLSPPEPLVEWALAIHAPASSALTPWLAGRLRERMRTISLDRSAAARAGADGARLAGMNRPGLPAGRGVELTSRDLRDELLESALRLAGRLGHRELTSPQIADAAGIPIEALLAHFTTPEACMAAAHAMVAERLCALAAEARASEPEWPRAVRPLVSALLTYLAARPLHAQALVQSSWCLGRHTLEAGTELTVRLAQLLSPDAAPPARRRQRVTPLAGEAAAHALWHTVRCLLASRRVQLLPALTDHLSFLVLAPALGAKPALALLRAGAVDR